MVTWESGANPELYQGTVKRSYPQKNHWPKAGKVRRREEAESGYKALSGISWGSVFFCFSDPYSPEYGFCFCRMVSRLVTSGQRSTD